MQRTRFIPELDLQKKKARPTKCRFNRTTQCNVTMSPFNVKLFNFMFRG